MMFADDRVLIEDNPEKFNNMLEEWRVALYEMELMISRNKTEYEFGERGQEVIAMSKDVIYLFIYTELILWFVWDTTILGDQIIVL